MLIKNIISYEDFETYMKNYDHIFINISANWCKPCMEIKPLIEKFVAVINEKNVIYLKLNYDLYDYDESFHFYFGVKKIPYFGYIKNGKLINTFGSSDFTFVSKKIFEIITLIKSEENSIGMVKSEENSNVIS